METKKLLKTIFETQFPDKLIIRVDGGAIKGLSFGHLSRCLILANNLKKFHSTKCLFLMKDYPEGIGFVTKQGFPVKTIPKELSLTKQKGIWLKTTIEFKPDWTIIDLPYEIPFNDMCDLIKTLGSKILFIDDSRFLNIKADVILNSSILARKKTQKIFTQTKYLLGPKYFIFDAPAPSLIKNRRKTINILISFGGSDPAGLSVKVLNILEKNKFKLKFDVSIVLGPGFEVKHPETATEIKSKKWIKAIDAPEDIYLHFINANIVICAGGRTLYELNELGIPAFPIASIEHEKEVVKMFIDSKKVVAGLIKWDKKMFLDSLNYVLDRYFPKKRGRGVNKTTIN